MEQIFIILLFVVPGMIIQMMKTFLRPRKNVIKPAYEYLSRIIVDSTIIFLVAIVILRLSSSSFTELITKLDSISYAIYYSLIILLLTILWYPIKYKLIIPLLYYIHNKFQNKKVYYETIPKSVWENFIDDGRADSWCAVTVYKDDKEITSGLLEMWQSHDSEDISFHIICQEKMSELKNECKSAFKIDDEYYDTSNGLRIVWYKQEILKEHWLKKFPE